MVTVVTCELATKTAYSSTGANVQRKGIPKVGSNDEPLLFVLPPSTAACYGRLCPTTISMPRVKQTSIYGLDDGSLVANVRSTFTGQQALAAFPGPWTLSLDFRLSASHRRQIRR